MIQLTGGQTLDIISESTKNADVMYMLLNLNKVPKQGFREVTHTHIYDTIKWSYKQLTVIYHVLICTRV